MQTNFFQVGVAGDTFQVQSLPVPTTPDLSMAAFNELRDNGLEAFCKILGLCQDSPLNENLLESVIPGAEEHNGAFRLTITTQE